MSEADTRTTNDGVTKDFNLAAGPEDTKTHEEPMPTLELNPPEPMGPGLGGMTPGSAQVHAPQISPQLHEKGAELDKASTPLVKRDFDQASRRGAFSEMFNRKAQQQENDQDLDR